MDLLTLASLGLAMILWGMQLKLRPFLVKNRKRISLASISIILIAMATKTHLLFIAWKNSEPPLKYLAPPYAPVSYFLHTAWTQILNQFTISLGIGLLFLGLIALLPKERKESIFEPDEPTIIMLCIFLTGHPLWIAYLSIAMLAYTLLSMRAHLKRKGQRVSFYRYWLPLTLVVVACANYILKLSILAQLRLYGG